MAKTNDNRGILSVDKTRTGSHDMIDNDQESSTRTENEIVGRSGLESLENKYDGKEKKRKGKREREKEKEGEFSHVIQINADQTAAT